MRWRMRLEHRPVDQEVVHSPVAITIEYPAAALPSTSLSPGANRALLEQLVGR